MDNRLKVMTDSKEFLKLFPDKKNLVKDYSNSEMLLLYINLRFGKDIFTKLKIKSNEDFTEKILSWLGNLYITDTDKVGIIEGKLYTKNHITEKDCSQVYKILEMKTNFQRCLYNLHKPIVRVFMFNNNGNLCGNVLLSCTDSEFMEALNSIDFEFTTVSNMLTAMRSDLIFENRQFGKIRTPNDVFLIDLENSDTDCVGVFASKLSD